MAQAAKDDAKALFPGTEVRLSCCVATVFPAGVKHARKLFTRVLPILQAVGGFAKRDGEDEKAHATRVSADMIPLALNQAIDIISDCVVLPGKAKLDDLPHFDLPPIADAWIQASFGEERKWRPWLALMETTAARFNGGEAVSMSEIWSRVSSRLATASPTSSKSDGPTSPTEDGPSPS